LRCLLIYDIVDDKIRTKVADICLDYGMERIQYSGFLGDLSHNRQEEILKKIQRKVGKHAANIQLFPICDKDLRLRRTLIVEQKAVPSTQGAQR